MNSLKLTTLAFLLLTVTSCGGGGSSTARSLDTEGETVGLSELLSLEIDQFSFFLDRQGIDQYGPEVWIFDAETGEPLVCSDGGLGMGYVQTESVIYSNLNATFRQVFADDDYQGKFFQVRFFNSKDSPCLQDNDDLFIGKTDKVNYETLTTLPLMSRDGSFFIWLKDNDAEGQPVVAAVADDLTNDAFYVDRISLAEGVNTGDIDVQPEVEVHILHVLDEENFDIDDDATWELVACSGEGEGLSPVIENELVYGRLYADLIPSFDLEDFSGEPMVVAVIDNDGTACPDAINFDSADSDSLRDDLIGQSDIMVWEDIPGSTVVMDSVEVGFTGFLEE